MTSYLLRRSFHLVIVGFLATLLIYTFLNLIPGGPLSGINKYGNLRTRLSQAEIARIDSALGLHKPGYLAYTTWVAGEDWLDEMGTFLGNPNLNGKLIFTGTWKDYQSTACQKAGGTNRGTDAAKPQPCNQGIIRWDWRESWLMANGQQETELIGERVKNSVFLMGSVTLISLLTIHIVSIISAMLPYSNWGDLTPFPIGLKRGAFLSLVGMVIVTEMVFNYPGISHLFIDAIQGSNWLIVMALLLITAILIFFTTLMGDVLYSIIEPRI